MRLPSWFWIGIAIWAVLGLPGLVLGLLYKGSPIPDAPPLLQHPYENYSFAANASWLLVMVLCFLPVFLTAALLIQRRRQRKAMLKIENLHATVPDKPSGPVA